jgi:2-methylfumaryl-CoA isomerase
VDYLANAEVGLPFMTGHEMLAGPVNHVLPDWDLLAGATTAMGVLAAVLRRRQGNGGTYAEVPLSDVAVSAVGTLGWLSEAAAAGDRPRYGNHIFGNFGVDFPTGDGHHVMVVALTGGQWRALCDATGTTEIFPALEAAIDMDLADEANRFKFRETIVGILNPWFLARDHEEVALALTKGHVLWAPYRRMSEAARNAVSGDGPGTLLHQPGVGPVVATRTAIRSPLGRETPEIAVPLGSDTADVLTGALGLSNADLGRLIDTGVVGD